MISFDFINGEDFRTSLENDYQELNKAMSVGAWKTVHVLAGSIVEAVLIDYLVAIDYQKEDPLQMSLGKAITTCKQEGILSEKAEHISHAIRSYRNLIHPGRSIRLREAADESGAKVAQGLVDMVVSEIAANKQKKFGYTAEQIIKKIINDSSTVAILGHFLKQTTEHEKKRLLITLIPQAYLEYWEPDEPGGSPLTSLTACFWVVFENASEVTKEKATKHIITIIKEESQEIPRIYLTNFFRGANLKYLSKDEVQLIKEYLLSIIEERISVPLLDAMQGIGEFLTSEDVFPLMNSVTRPLRQSRTYAGGIESNDVKGFLSKEFTHMNEEVKRKLSSFFAEESWPSLSDSFKVTLADFRNYLLELEFFEAPPYADPFLPDLPDDL